MENIEICEMTLQDFEEIKSILISDFDDFWSADILKNELIGKNKKYIVAKLQNEIIGFAGIMINIPDTEIMNIVVKKNFRKKGIGGILLKKIIELSQKLCCEKIFLEVNEKNIPALKLYENEGFHQVGKRKKYYDNKYSAIIMCYNLRLNLRNREKFCVSKISLDSIGRRVKRNFARLHWEESKEKFRSIPYE